MNVYEPDTIPYRSVNEAETMEQEDTTINDLSINQIENAEYALQVTTSTDNEPTTYQDALNHPDADQWKAAMMQELNAIERAGVYEEVDRPPD